VTDRCKHGNETSISIEGGEFCDQLRDNQFHKKDSNALSAYV